MRNDANLNQLLVLANMESYNAILIEQGKLQSERLILFRNLAISQINGYSLDAQKTKMKAFCDYNEYEIAGEYEDAGKLMISVLSAVGEIERENIRVQTMEGRMQKAREGKWNCKVS